VPHCWRGRQVDGPNILVLRWESILINGKGRFTGGLRGGFKFLKKREKRLRILHLFMEGRAIYIKSKQSMKEDEKNYVPFFGEGACFVREGEEEGRANTKEKAIGELGVRT